jgi:hypothetical protein
MCAQKHIIEYNKKLMNRLIIIGNGFDLASDLESNYSQFILWYLKKCLSIENRLKESNLFQFRNINESVEKSILKNSTSVEDFFIRIEANQIKHDTIDPRIGFLKRIINDVSKKKWVDIETLYFSYLLKLKERNEVEDVKNGLIGELNNILSIISENLEEYLHEQIPKIEINDAYFESVKRLMFCEDLSKLNFGNGEFNKSNTLILNFNYTNLTKKWVDEQINTSQINIHGELKNIENQIIFGYGDNTHHKYLELEQANNTDYLRNIKTMSYPLTSNYNTLMYFLNSGKINSESEIEHNPNFEVLIYGHSCGLSDRILLKTIFEHKNCKDIHVAYHNDKNDYFHKTIEISRHFTKKDEFLKKLKSFNELLKVPQMKKDNK